MGTLLFLVGVYVFVYCLATFRWLEKYVVRLFLPYWFVVFLENAKFYGFRKFLKLTFLMVVSWYALGLLVLLFTFSNDVEFGFSWLRFGIIAYSDSSTTILVFSLQWMVHNTLGTVYGFFFAKVVDYTKEIRRAIYLIPKIKTAVSSTDPEAQSYLEVKRLNNSDYEIKTNAPIQEGDLIGRQEEIENSIGKSVGIIRLQKTDTGTFLIRTGKLKTKIITEGGEKFVVSDVQPDDLDRVVAEKEFDLDAMNIIALGHDGVETEYHDWRADPTCIIVGIRRSGKTNLATHMADETVSIKAPYLYIVASDLVKAGLHWNMARYNYSDLTKGGDPNLINNDTLCERMRTARLNKNFSLFTQDDEYVRAVNALEIELVKRNNYLVQHPKCTKWADLYDPKKNGNALKAPPPEILWLEDEWSLRAQRYWQEKRNPAVELAMNKVIGFVTEAANRGVYIVFMAHKMRINEEFKTARDQCKFFYGYGVTTREIGYSSEMEAQRPKAIRGGFVHVDESQFSRGLSSFCCPEVTPIDFCRTVTDAYSHWHSSNYKWLMNWRASLKGNFDDAIMQQVNVGQIELLST